MLTKVTVVNTQNYCIVHLQLIQCCMSITTPIAEKKAWPLDYNCLTWVMGTWRLITLYSLLLYIFEMVCNFKHNLYKIHVISHSDNFK